MEGNEGYVVYVHSWFRKDKEKAMDVIRVHWVKRVQTEPTDVDSVARGVFVSIVRAVIIEHLVEKAGLQLK